MPNILLSYIQTITTNSPKIRKSGNELSELKIASLKLFATALILSNLPKYLSNKPLPKCFILALLYTDAKKKQLFAAGTKTQCIEQNSF